MCKELETVCCERLVRLLSTELDSEECANVRCWKSAQRAKVVGPVQAKAYYRNAR